MIDLADHILGKLAILASEGNPDEQRIAEFLLEMAERSTTDRGKLLKIFRLAADRARMIRSQQAPS